MRALPEFQADSFFSYYHRKIEKNLKKFFRRTKDLDFVQYIFNLDGKYNLACENYENTFIFSILRVAIENRNF